LAAPTTMRNPKKRRHLGNTLDTRASSLRVLYWQRVWSVPYLVAPCFRQ
jgi:hypothetical protein